MADLDNKKIIKKLEEASNSNEKTSFFNEDISNLRLTKLNMNGHLFKKCSFYVTSFFGCVFTKCEFLDCDFSNSDLLNVKFLDCTFVNCNFTEATLQDVLVEGGFKSNNIFRKLNIVGNVTGISEEESEIISEENEILDTFNIFTKEDNEYILKSSNKQVILSISPETETTWRITLGVEPIDSEYDSVLSETIEFPITAEKLYNDIETILKYAIFKVLKLNNIDLIEGMNEIYNKFINVNFIEKQK